MEKECFECKEVKPLDMFYKHPEMGDGRLGKCKECIKRDVRANRKKRLEYYKAYDKQRYDESSARRKSCGSGQPPSADATKLYREKYKDNKSARNKAMRAMLKGEILKPVACSRCGAITKLHAHHPDYSEPLAVEWLCPACHGLRHRKDGPRTTEGMEKGSRYDKKD